MLALALMSLDSTVEGGLMDLIDALLCFCGCCCVLQNVPPDLSICTFVLEQSLSVRALQEMLANTEEKAEGASNQAPIPLDGRQRNGFASQCSRLFRW